MATRPTKVDKSQDVNQSKKRNGKEEKAEKMLFAEMSFADI